MELESACNLLKVTPFYKHRMSPIKLQHSLPARSMAHEQHHCAMLFEPVNAGKANDFQPHAASFSTADDEKEHTCGIRRSRDFGDVVERW